MRVVDDDFARAALARALDRGANLARHIAPEDRILVGVARIALLPRADAGRAFHIARNVDIHALLSQSVLRFASPVWAATLCGLARSARSVERNRVCKLIRGQIHVGELRERDVVVRMRGDPRAQRLKLRDDRRRRAAFDRVLRSLGRACFAARAAGRLSEDRAGDAESNRDEIRHDARERSRTMTRRSGRRFAAEALDPFAGTMSRLDAPRRNLA